MRFISSAERASRRCPVSSLTANANAPAVGLFLAKYDTTGAEQWVKRTTGPNGSTQAYSAGNRLDSLGNSYVAGCFFGSPTFGPAEAKQTTLGPSSSDTFVARFDSAGALQWVKRTTGGGTATGIGLDPVGNSYVTGQFSASTTFGAGEPLQTTLASHGSGDSFLARYDRTGKFHSAKQIGGAGNSSPRGPALDAQTNLYVTSGFGGVAIFGPGEVGQTQLTATSGLDIFTAGYGAVDTDADGVPNALDNCPPVANAGQTDSNGDGIGDACVAPAAIAGQNVQIGLDPVIGPGTTLSTGVVLGDNARIGSNVVLSRNVVAGNNVTIGDATNAGQTVQIRSDVIIGSNVIIDQGVIIGPGARIGDNCVIGQYSVIGSNATLDANVRLGQRVNVAPNAVIAAGTTVPAKASVP